LSLLLYLKLFCFCFERLKLGTESFILSFEFKKLLNMALILSNLLFHIANFFKALFELSIFEAKFTSVRLDTFLAFFKNCVHLYEFMDWICCLVDLSCISSDRAIGRIILNFRLWILWIMQSLCFLLEFKICWIFE
jgi:hypothetical protein